MTSGMTSGAVVMPESSVRPLNGPKRASTSARERAEHDRDRRDDRRDLQAAARPRSGSARCRISSPYHLRREAAPDRHEPRLVERVDDQRQDRDVQEREAEHQRRDPEPGATPAFIGAPLRLGAPAQRWKIMIGITSSSSSAIATALATGQSRLLKNSVHSTLPIISDARAAEQRGITNSPTAGMNTSMRAGDDAGHRQRQRDLAGTPSTAGSRGPRPPRAASDPSSRGWSTAAGS